MVRGRARVIAINDALFLEPRADAHYVCDNQWFDWHQGRPELEFYAGLRLTLENFHLKRRWSNIRCLQNAGAEGLATDPWAVCTGHNSGYQAINAAYHLGAARIILLGYDMGFAKGQRSHYFGDHPRKTQPSIYKNIFLPAFPTLVDPLGQRGVEVVNATPGSKLDCWPRMSLADALTGMRTRAVPPSLACDRARLNELGFIGKRAI